MLILRIPADKLQTNLEKRSFFDHLTASMKYSQQLAVNQSHSTTIYFDLESNSIIFRNIPAEMGNSRLILPDNLELMTNYTIRYLPNGRINQFRTINFYDNYNNKQIKLVLQLGNGQFEIQE